MILYKKLEYHCDLTHNCALEKLLMQKEMLKLNAFVNKISIEKWGQKRKKNCQWISQDFF